ncbi:MAG: phenylacetate-CoA oxygenase subunit PaaC [Bacteroidia bacterium]|nr:phenylacetate-CoA oxygenase subunit PaaC [Bacteroidia bacterium]MCZ2276640.1 phenylacetate-CoA oxygenase subunit PaaC [Bacteroidia bacterium]
MTKQEALVDFCLQIGDTSLIHGQRLAEWCGHAPILEEDIALTNISLDLIGQARMILTYAGQTENKHRDEDKLSFHRDAWDFRNVLIAELPNGDFAFTMGKIFLLGFYMKNLFTVLSNSKDPSLKAFAEKSLKEVIYHCRHAADWVIRLGDGTIESKERMQKALNELALYTDDLFEVSESEKILVQEKLIPSLADLKTNWSHDIAAVITQATLKLPQANNALRLGGKAGLHTEHLGHILSDMQFLQRAYPDAKW